MIFKKNFHILLSIIALLILAYVFNSGYSKKDFNNPYSYGIDGLNEKNNVNLQSSDVSRKKDSEQVKQFRDKQEAYAKEIPLELLNEYYEKIGPDKILDIIEEDKYCHNKGHNVGRTIYKKLNDLNQSLQVCTQRCSTGCFHGVLMELFGSKGEHIEFEGIKDRINSICDLDPVKDAIQKGVCVHGVGHALMNLAEYDLNLGLKYCNTYKDPGLMYYCATGLYMERDSALGEDDAKVSAYYPCDKFAFPAGCFRWKIGRVFEDNKYEDAVSYCLNLKDSSLRHGCFHGIGFSFYKVFESNPLKLDEICSKGDRMDNKMCIEGAIGLLTEFNKDNALNICETVYKESKTEKKDCINAVSVRNFGLNRDFQRYAVIE